MKYNAVAFLESLYRAAPEPAAAPDPDVRVKTSMRTGGWRGRIAPPSWNMTAACRGARRGGGPDGNHPGTETGRCVPKAISLTRADRTR